MKTFETAKRRLPDYQIEFELDGEKYHFTPPPSTGIWLSSFEDHGAAQVKAQLDWLGVGLEEDEAARILERLKDPTDDFDIENALTIVGFLMQEVAAHPTGPSSG